MTHTPQPEDSVADNQKSLNALVRALRLSQGQFGLILVRCNYGELRQRIVQRLRELLPVPIRELNCLGFQPKAKSSSQNRADWIRVLVHFNGLKLLAKNLSSWRMLRLADN